MLHIRTEKTTLTFALALALLLLFAAFDSFYGKCRAVRENTLRLHVIAASDSEADQRNKLLVRDAILEEFSPALAAGRNVDDAVRVTEQLTGAIEESAERCLRAAGCEDAVTASVVTMDFDTVTYDGGETMPAGEYRALRIVIGEGAGHNWWCVMYPPLCVPAAAGRTDEEARIHALNGETHAVAKFAVVEWYEKLRAALGGKQALYDGAGKETQSEMP